MKAGDMIWELLHSSLASHCANQLACSRSLSLTAKSSEFPVWLPASTLLSVPIAGGPAGSTLPWFWDRGRI